MRILCTKYGHFVSYENKVFYPASTVNNIFIVGNNYKFSVFSVLWLPACEIVGMISHLRI